MIYILEIIAFTEQNIRLQSKRISQIMDGMGEFDNCCRDAFECTF